MKTNYHWPVVSLSNPLGTALLAVIALVFLAGPSTAIGSLIWDVTADFSVDNGNPNGAWSYGWMDTGFSTFTLHPHGDYDATGCPRWYSDNSANMWKNMRPYTDDGVAPGQLSLHPGSGTEPSVARWTALAGVSGSATIEGEFFAGDSGQMLVDVRINGVEVWNAVDSGAFNLATTVAPGDTIDFAVYDGYGFGNTPLDATITVVPEPATICLLGLGALSLIRRKK